MKSNSIYKINHFDPPPNELKKVKSRVSAVATGFNGVRRDLAAMAEADARLQVTIDRLGDRVDRIERRLELRENN